MLEFGNEGVAPLRQKPCSQKLRLKKRRKKDNKMSKRDELSGWMEKATKIIGKTQSGKNIYHLHNYTRMNNTFTPQDHTDADNLHMKLAGKAHKAGDIISRDKHEYAAGYHSSSAIQKIRKDKTPRKFKLNSAWQKKKLAAAHQGYKKVKFINPMKKSIRDEMTDWLSKARK